MMPRIIKTIWGNIDYVKQEVEGKFKFPNEIVYVWGSDNQQYLKDLGYETILVSSENMNPLYNTLSKMYYHKLEAIIEADSTFENYILIDWDTYTEKKLDQEFIKLLNNKSEIQCPLYSLPISFYDEISKVDMDNNYFDFFTNQNILIPKYSWNLNDSRVIPNFSFFYSRNAKIGKKLMQISKEENILSNIEEFSLYKLVDCSLEKYIENHEPVVAIGQTHDSLNIVQKSLDELNSFIRKRVNKVNYIKHK